jgi:hypothetical protein
MGPPSYMRPVDNRNVVMRRIPVQMRMRKASTPTPYRNTVGYMNILRHNHKVTSQSERYCYWGQQNPAVGTLSNPAQR